MLNNFMQKGFTLIELLVVVAIIVILVSVVLISLFGGRDKAKVARFKQAVHSIQTAAIKACYDGQINYTNITGSFGVIPTNIIKSISENQPWSNCGPAGTATFNISIESEGITTPCTAVINQTGITSFTGC
jgi:prepilin-type N-terminal cleavage/methylation domain-containing protein